MQFTLRGSDPRFAPLRRLLTEDGHTLGEEGILLAPPSAREGLPYYKNEVYAIRNAALTAEAALALLMRRCARPMQNLRVLLVGYGRIGRLLAPRLQALGARVTVAARDPRQRAWARCEGCQSVDITQIRPTYDAVVNTAPAPLLCGGYGGALCLDLASAPGGWSDDTPVLRVPGLPGLYAPCEAAQILRDAVYDTLKEEPSWKN